MHDWRGSQALQPLHHVPFPTEQLDLNYTVIDKTRQGKTNCLFMSHPSYNNIWYIHNKNSLVKSNQATLQELWETKLKHLHRHTRTHAGKKNLKKIKINKTKQVMTCITSYTWQEDKKPDGFQSLQVFHLYSDN